MTDQEFKATAANCSKKGYGVEYSQYVSGTDYGQKVFTLNKKHFKRNGPIIGLVISGKENKLYFNGERFEFIMPDSIVFELLSA